METRLADVNQPSHQPEIWFKNVCRFIAAAVFFLCVSAAGAVTSNDYYKAGLTLYNAKDYDKAILYFGAAIKLDMQNVAAYQGRGNCYYAKGNYSSALEDYKQVQKLQPSPQINQFVDKVQAKADLSASPAPAANTFSDEYNRFMAQGKNDFRLKQYSSAAQDFEKALRLNHSDFNLYYYLGLTYKLVGDLKDAVVALGIANQKRPTPQIASYVKALRAKLSQDDRDWADQQLSASAGGKDVNLHTKPADATDYGLRLEPGIIFPNLVDFNTEANNGVSFAISQGNATYDAAIPNLSANIGFEPVVNLEPDIEMGLLIASIPVGTFSEQYTQGSLNVTNTYAITGYVLGLNFRWLIGDGPVKFFLAAGPLVTPISINYTNTVNSVPTTGNFTSWAMGGQGQMGIDFHLSSNISFGPFVSFQAITANSFTGTLVDNSNNINTTATLYTVPNQWPAIQPIPASTAAPTGATATSVDLSGIVPGIHLSLFF